MVGGTGLRVLWLTGCVHSRSCVFALVWVCVRVSTCVCGTSMRQRNVHCCRVLLWTLQARTGSHSYSRSSGHTLHLVFSSSKSGLPQVHSNTHTQKAQVGQVHHFLPAAILIFPWSPDVHDCPSTVKRNKPSVAVQPSPANGRSAETLSRPALSSTPFRGCRKKTITPHGVTTRHA